MDKPKPNNNKHIDLSEDDLKKVAGGKKANKVDTAPPPADDPAPAADAPK
jgi:hypothetical protein